MDVKIKKQHFILRYKFQIAIAILFVGITVYLLMMSTGASRLKQDINNLMISEVKDGKFWNI